MGNDDYADLWSEASLLWNEVIRLVLETGSIFAHPARTMGSIGDRAVARHIGAFARHSERHVLKYLSSAHLSGQEEQAIRESVKQIDEALRLLSRKRHRRSQMKRFS
jgi:hypothetical protein